MNGNRLQIEIFFKAITADHKNIIKIIIIIYIIIINIICILFIVIFVFIRIIDDNAFESSYITPSDNFLN